MVFLRKSTKEQCSLINWFCDLRSKIKILQIWEVKPTWGSSRAVLSIPCILLRVLMGRDTCLTTNQGGQMHLFYVSIIYLDLLSACFCFSLFQSAFMSKTHVHHIIISPFSNAPRHSCLSIFRQAEGRGSKGPSKGTKCSAWLWPVPPFLSPPFLGITSEQEMRALCSVHSWRHDTQSWLQNRILCKALKNMDAQAPPLEILILTGQVCELGVKFFKAFQVILICNQSQESLVRKLPQRSIAPTSLTLDTYPQMAHIQD